MSADPGQNFAVDGGASGPFRVTWRLSQPVCLSERPLHLDALLAWARVKEALQSGVTPEQALNAQENLPLDIAAEGDSQVWKASALLFRFRSTPFLVPMTRRTNLEELAFARGRIITTRKGQISQGTGPFKEFDLRATCQWVEKVEAYGVGELESVRKLLKHLTAIGKLTRNGWGKIGESRVYRPDCHCEYFL